MFRFVITILVLLTPWFAEAQVYNWAFGIGGSDTQFGRQCKIDGSGNVYVFGDYRGITDFDPDTIVNYNLDGGIYGSAFLAKYDRNGKFNWVVRINGNRSVGVYKFDLDPFENPVITGFFRDTINVYSSTNVSARHIARGTYASYIIKYDTAGTHQWTTIIDGTLATHVFGMEIGNGSIYITGRFSGISEFDPTSPAGTYTSVGNDDIFISQYDLSGNFIDIQIIGNIGSGGYGWDISLSGSVIYLTGEFTGTVDFDPDTGIYMLTSVATRNWFIAKYQQLGELEWVNTFNTPALTANMIKMDIENDAVGNIIGVGYFYGTIDFDPSSSSFDMTSLNGSEAFMAKYNSDGELDWAKQWGGYNHAKALGIYIDDSSFIHVVGEYWGIVDFDPSVIDVSKNSQGSTGLYWSKFNQSGIFLDNMVLDGTSSAAMEDIVSDDSNNFYMTGYFHGTVDFDDDSNSVENLTASAAGDAFVAKYSPKECKDPNVPNLTNAPAVTCINDTVLIKTSPSDSLNSAKMWFLYSDSCNGTFLDTSTTGVFFVKTTYNRWYYVRGEGGCNGPGECDSIYISTIPIWNIQSTVYMCAGDSVFLNQDYVNTAGIYLDTFANQFGCDSIITTDLRVIAIDKGIDSSSSFLRATSLIGSYQWFECSTGLIVQGETNRKFIPTISGIYGVIVSVGSCSDTSDCVEIKVENTGTGIPNNSSKHLFKIYPTPTNGALIFELEVSVRGLLEFYNELGELVYSESIKKKKTSITLPMTMQSGMFICNFVSEDSYSTQKFILQRR